MILATVLAGCGGPPDPEATAPPLCLGELTAIGVVQGDDFVSPLVGQSVALRGVVTRLETDSGFYLEQSGPASRNSHAIFIADEKLSNSVGIGQVIGISGRVEELGSGRDSMTSLVDPDGYSVCAEQADLPLTRVSLPLDAQRREMFEGMRLAFDQPLSLTDHFDMHRGEWTLTPAQPLRLSTEDGPPGSAAAEVAQQNRASSIEIVLPGPDYPALPIGASVSNVQGVLGHNDGAQRLLVEFEPHATAAEPDVIDPPASGRLRMVSLNLLNYFNGDGRGGGFPTERGASSLADFHAQQGRTAAALELLQPHLLGIQELENDGFGRFSAARSLLELLNATGPSDWAFVDPGVEQIGGDVITVGLFYRQEMLEPLGPAELLHAPPFKGRSRVPLAQLFRVRSSGNDVLVVVNHLKSKGRCPTGGADADQGDGQGCWNPSRVAAVRALLPWLDALANKGGTQQVLILGDMNAWRREEPINSYREGGYIELVEELSGLPQHSFLYFGQRGTLDYALASPSLANRARQAMIWHINADWPRDMALPQPWLRMSDHDPVVVDFDFSQAVTSD